MIEPVAPEPPIDILARLAEYTAHIREVGDWFNEYARVERLGVRIDTDKAVLAVEDIKTSLSRVAPFLSRKDDTGVLHREQLVTAIDAIMKILANPNQAGLILGALQSGKTTTGLALQLVGPIYYRLTGKRLHPFYLLTSQTSHQLQTTHELHRFSQYYGDLAFTLDEEVPNANGAVDQAGLDPLFLMSPTLNMYREYVLQNGQSTFTIPKVEDFVWRRAWGENVIKIADWIESLARAGSIPLMIIDEPQFGASDRIVVKESGPERVKCVFTKIFTEIAGRLNIAKGEHVFIALSATPYEIHDLKKIWTIHQSLGETYCGFDFFAGDRIDGRGPKREPRVTDFVTFGDELGVPFLARVDLAAFYSFERFAKRKKKLRYEGTWDQYKEDVLAALRATFLALKAKHQGEVFGVCIRAVNNNVKAEEVIRMLGIEAEYDIVRYFGPDGSGKSVKQALDKASGERPYIIAVTNRARLGDAFPANVKYFVEFTEQFTDLNSMMQGLVGRACGYGKESTIVLSSKNAITMHTVSAALGGYIMNPSRHTIVAGSKRRGRPTVILPIDRNPGDAKLEEVFAALDERIVKPIVLPGRKTLQTKRSSGRRTGPILRVFEETGAFDYIESEAARKRYYPDYPQFQIARREQKVQNPARLGKFLSYFLDDDGDCRYTLRERRGELAQHSGLRARGRSGGDDDEARDAEHEFLEPQILVEKYDPATGEPIRDYAAADDDRAPGDWRAIAIVMPLLHPVQEFVAGDAAYPLETSPYNDWMLEDETERRDAAVDARDAAAEEMRRRRAG